MKILKKHFQNKMMIGAGVILIIYLLAQLTANILLGNDLTLRLDCITNPGTSQSEVTVQIEEDDIVQLTDVELTEDKIILSFSPLHSGETMVEVTDAAGDYLASAYLHVSGTGLITDRSSGSFSHYRISSLLMLIMLCSMTLLFWMIFAQSEITLRYSYISIFTCGFAIWFTIICAVFAVLWIRGSDMMGIYCAFRSAARYFMLFTFPVILIFSVLLTISNISLIRHEGFRMQNALGIGLSAALVVGFFLLIFVSDLYSSGSEFSVHVYDSATGIFFAIYALLECFLMGAVVCGTMAALHEPAYDKDYLIILGCKIRNDGTLYPLLRGRADRAIRFYRKQLETTGKEAIFVPSGGQGSDEVISESEAIARYLREQGIEESRIRLENRSKNTRQNMEFSRALIEKEMPGAKTAFSTTNYHVLRSGIISRQVDFDPDGMGSPTRWYFWPNAYIREVIGMITYTWRSLVIIFLPIAVFLTVMEFIA